MSDSAELEFRLAELENRLDGIVRGITEALEEAREAYQRAPCDSPEENAAHSMLHAFKRLAAGAGVKL